MQIPRHPMPSPTSGETAWDPERQDPTASRSWRHSTPDVYHRHDKAQPFHSSSLSQTEEPLPSTSRVHPYVGRLLYLILISIGGSDLAFFVLLQAMTFTSPIDLLDTDADV